MTYKELLTKDEWKLKRNEILERDNHTCKRCGIDKDFKFNQKGVLVDSDFFSENQNHEFFKPTDLNTNLIKITKGDNILVCKTSLNSIDFSTNKKYVIVFNISVKNRIDYNYNGSNTFRKHQNIFSNPNYNKKAFRELSKYFDEEQYTVDKEGFWFIELEREYEFYKRATFHVHHKCYRKNIEIWSQNSSEYDTLCNVCHRIVHENQKIPYYDESGNIFSELNPCSRCGGQRYFDCYKHVDGGICFQCNGLGFI